ncbi:MAG: hypothetical protein Kow0027_15070 [Saprospiraceae bacterium]
MRGERASPSKTPVWPGVSLSVGQTGRTGTGWTDEPERLSFTFINHWKIRLRRMTKRYLAS